MMCVDKCTNGRDHYAGCPDLRAAVDARRANKRQKQPEPRAPQCTGCDDLKWYHQNGDAGA